MSLHWTVIAIFLYSEMAFLLLLMLPFIPPTWWRRFFDSRLVRYIEKHSHIIYYTCGGILLLLLFEAIREVIKYGNVNLSVEDKFVTPHGDTAVNMRLFRAERNLYIAGFTVFLYLVCRRMVQMLIKEARLSDTAEIATKRAQINGVHSPIKEKKESRLKASKAD